MRALTPIFAALAAALLAGAVARADIVDRIDQPAAEIAAAKWWNGAAPKLDAFRGKVVVLHLSDPARATSKAFLPNLVRIGQTRRDEPLVIVEVLDTADETLAAKYVEENAKDVTWLVGWDANGTVAQAYPGTSVPRTYVIGPDGRIAWHAHIGALTREALDGQVARCAFWDLKAVPAAARPAAKAVFELRFGDAVAAADKVFEDPRAPGEAKAFAARVKKEVARAHAQHKEIVEALTKDLDWATLYRRVERMLPVYKGTLYEPEVKAKWEELNANKRVLYIVEQQRLLEQLVKGVHKMNLRDLEKVRPRVREVAVMNPDTKVERNAMEWVAEIDARIAKLSRK